MDFNFRSILEGYDRVGNLFSQGFRAMTLMISLVFKSRLLFFQRANMMFRSSLPDSSKRCCLFRCYFPTGTFSRSLLVIADFSSCTWSIHRMNLPIIFDEKGIPRHESHPNLQVRFTAEGVTVHWYVVSWSPAELLWGPRSLAFFLIH